MVDRAIAEQTRTTPDIAGQNFMSPQRRRRPLVGRTEQRDDRHAQRRREMHRTGMFETHTSQPDSTPMSSDRSVDR